MHSPAVELIAVVDRAIAIMSDADPNEALSIYIRELEANARAGYTTLEVAEVLAKLREIAGVA